MTARNVQRSAAQMPAWRSPVAWLTLLVVFVGGLTLDLWSKDWAFRSVGPVPVELDRDIILANAGWKPPYHESMEVLPWGLLDFDLVLNHGAVFGIGQQQRMIFITFTIVAVIVATLIFAFWTLASSHAAHVGIGLILAGGLGNLYDRIAFGAVRDFMHMVPGWDLPFGWAWPRGGSGLFPWVFNGADVLLLVGMAILILRSSREPSATDHSDGGLDVDQQADGERVS
jgi:lipoprotein signal peptidase